MDNFSTTSRASRQNPAGPSLLEAKLIVERICTTLNVIGYLQDLSEAKESR
jgi:hypothetical protein